MSDYKLEIAELLVRTFAGILFLFQGYDKLFRIKMPGVIDAFAADANRYHIPRPILSIVAYYTSIVELLGGFFLIAGFLTSYTLYALGIDLVLVSLAFSFMNPMWDMKYVFPRFVLLIVVLIMPENYQLFSVDHLINLK